MTLGFPFFAYFAFFAVSIPSSFFGHFRSCLWRSISRLGLLLRVFVLNSFWLRLSRAVPVAANYHLTTHHPVITSQRGSDPPVRVPVVYTIRWFFEIARPADV